MDNEGISKNRTTQTSEITTSVENSAISQPDASHPGWDGFVSAVLSHNTFATELLLRSLPADLLALADISTLQPISEKLPPTKGKKHATHMDMVCKVALDNGSMDLLLHIEHQSSYDKRIGQRIDDYQRGLRERYFRSTPGQPREPLIYSILLYHGKHYHKPLLHWSQRLPSEKVRQVVSAMSCNTTCLIDVRRMDDEQIRGFGALAPVMLILRDLNDHDLADLLPRLTELLNQDKISEEERQLIMQFAMLNGDTKDWPAVRQFAASTEKIYGDTYDCSPTDGSPETKSRSVCDCQPTVGRPETKS